MPRTASRAGAATPAVDSAPLGPAAGLAATADNALAVRNPAGTAQATTSLSIQVRSVSDLQSLAQLFAASGMFGRSQNQQQTLAQCAVQLLAGMEAGFTPFASITGIYVVNGRPGFSAQLLAQAIKRHPRYDYRVLEKTAEVCRIKFLADGEELGVEVFSMDMARRAGLVSARGPWSQYPEAMLFARCLTAGMRTHCPDALGGHTPYTPEELGAATNGDIDEYGMVIAEKLPPASPPAIDRDQLVTQALRVVKTSGLTAAGMRSMLDQLGGPSVNGLGQLDDAILQRLIRQGISPETVARWNDSSEPSTDDTADDVPDDDDKPLSWDLEESA